MAHDRQSGPHTPVRPGRTGCACLPLPGEAELLDRFIRDELFRLFDGAALDVDPAPSQTGPVATTDPSNTP